MHEVQGSPAEGCPDEHSLRSTQCFADDAQDPRGGVELFDYRSIRQDHETCVAWIVVRVWHGGKLCGGVRSFR